MIGKVIAPAPGSEDPPGPGPLAGVFIGVLPVEGVIGLRRASTRAVSDRERERCRAEARARGTPATFGAEPRFAPGTFRPDPVEEDRLAGRSLSPARPARQRPKRAPRRADDPDEQPPGLCGRCEGNGPCVNCAAARIEAARQGRDRARADRADDPDRDEGDFERCERGDL